MNRPPESSHQTTGESKVELDGDINSKIVHSLDSQLGQLDSKLSRRLDRIRYQVVNGPKARSRIASLVSSWPRAAFVGLAASVLFAVFITANLNFGAGSGLDSTLQAVLANEDFELIDEDFELMMEDVEFYLWLESNDNVLSSPTG